jgi:uncharacterized damage-inducible protein DinB
MVQMMKWFDRKFTFELPVWMYPIVIERLRGTPARVEDLFRGVAIPANVLTHRNGNVWSIQENIGHLLDLEPLWIGRVEDILNGALRLRDADLTNRKTYDANHNESSIQEILSSFRTLRGQLVRQLDELEDSVIVRTALHPRLEQPMRLLDLISFVAEHDDYHLAQITRVKKLS